MDPRMWVDQDRDQILYPGGLQVLLPALRRRHDVGKWIPEMDPAIHSKGYHAERHQSQRKNIPPQAMPGTAPVHEIGYYHSSAHDEAGRLGHPRQQSTSAGQPTVAAIDT